MSSSHKTKKSSKSNSGSASSKSSTRHRRRPTPPLPSNLSYVGKGAYGCIVRPALPNRRDDTWHQYPNQVTKLFFNKNDMINANAKSHQMYEMLGHNESHRMHRYTHKYRTTNLPSNVRTRCKRFNSNKPLYPLRMQNLGNDFWNMRSKYTKYRSIYVGTILDQILKIMKQIQILVNNSMIHGDVRETNLMIHPQTGTMTLIDFDLLFPSDAYYDHVHLGFYCHPPETFLYDKLQFYLNASPADVDAELNSVENRERIQKYAKHHSRFSFASPEYLDRRASVEDIKRAIKDSIFYFTTRLDVEESESQLQAEFRKMMLPSYDGYGLAFTLLEFISFVYPTITNHAQKPTFDASLQRRITNASLPYTDAEIHIIRTTLYKLVFDVLEHMADLRIQRRMNIHKAIERTEAIINEFHTKIKKMTI